MAFRILLILSFIVLGIVPTFSQEAEVLPSLSYNELISRQKDYEGKRVRVSGYWRIFFEENFLYDPLEPNFHKNGAWVEFGGEEDICKGSRKKLREIGKDYMGDLSVVFIGKLQTGRRFGHENGYQYQFVVDCVEKIKKLPKNQRAKNEQSKTK
ncbi:MAG: hypothetical protein ACRD43_01810 [Pyrinomonadaceae bacterium]